MCVKGTIPDYRESIWREMNKADLGKELIRKTSPAQIITPPLPPTPSLRAAQGIWFQGADLSPLYPTSTPRPALSLKQQNVTPDMTISPGLLWEGEKILQFGLTVEKSGAG